MDSFKYFITDFIVSCDPTHIIQQLLQKDSYFCTFDLKNGYHHISILEEHQTFIGFSWTYSDGTTKYLIFLVLVFGLASACYAFTKLLRPLVKRWRGLGIRCAIYLDDGIFGNKSFNKTTEEMNLIVKDLQSAGLTLNTKKCVLIQRSEWLGFIIDTIKMEFSIPHRKISHLEKLIENILNGNFVTPKQISRIAGQIISMSLAIGPITNLFTRQMYKFIESRIHWNTLYPLNECLLSEIYFWKENLKNSNG